jgi:adenylate cyclase
MVYVDDASHQRLGQSYSEPWPRSYYAKLLSRLTVDKARAVVFDIIFIDPRDPVTDKQFADAIHANGNVILAADWTISENGVKGGKSIDFFLPNSLFATNAAGLGFSDTSADKDMCTRTYLPHGADQTGKSLEYGDLGWAAASLMGAPATKDITESQKPIWLNYYGPTAVIPSVSLYQVLADNDSNAPPGLFTDKVVFVGVRLHPALQATRIDEYRTPFSNLAAGDLMPGVAIHATACLNLIRGDWLRRFSHSTESMIIIGFGILLGWGLVLCRPIPAILAALTAVILIAVLNYCLFVFLRFWFPWLIVVVGQIPVALVSALEVRSRSRKSELSV